MSDELDPRMSRREVLGRMLSSPMCIGLLSTGVAEQVPPAAPSNVTVVQSPSGEGPTLTHSMGIGGATDTSVKYRARADREALIQLEMSPSSDLSGSRISSGVTVRSDSDFTGGETITGLMPRTIYYYSILVDGRRAHSVPFPRFRTLPVVGVDTNVKVVFGSCQTSPIGSAIFGSIGTEDPDIFIHLGDFGYPDSTVVDVQRENYKTQYGGAFQTEIVDRMPRAHIWDDHDYGQNNSNGDLPGKGNSLRIFKEYIPSYDLPNGDNGLWHSFKIANAEFFVLDTRYQREGSKPQFGVGLNLVADQGSSSDRLVLRAADAPSPYNNWYTSWYAGITTALGTYMRRVVGYSGASRYCTLDSPVPELNDTSTYFLRRASMLDMDMIPGGQTDWLIAAMEASGARWKVLVTSIPWNPTCTESDAWGGWDNSDAEWKYLTQKLANVDNVIVLSGDRHASAIDDGSAGGWPEGTAGPFNAQVYDISGAWSHGKYRAGHSYGVLTLGADSATLAIKDATGSTVSSVTPLTVTPR